MGREPDLSIGAVAAATGLSVEVLRSWEGRYGFPKPHRLPGGHRRYSDAQVLEIGHVQADRNAGISLEVAIGRTRLRAERSERSIYAALRRTWPEQHAHVISKRAILAISRAIEDETIARADRPVVVGCFQAERFYRQSEPRWKELARTASSAIVFAGFASTRTPKGRVAEIALANDDPLLREWAVICDSQAFSACVLAVELGGRESRDRRRFEAVWSTDPPIVRWAIGVAARLAGPVPGAADVLANRLAAHDPATAHASAAAIFSRAIGYLDR